MRVFFIYKKGIIMNAIQLSHEEMTSFFNFGWRHANEADPVDRKRLEAMAEGILDCLEQTPVEEGGRL